VLRRIIRRAARHGNKLGASGPFFHKLVTALVKEMGAAYPELVQKQDQVREHLLQEEQRFGATLSAGLRILDNELSSLEGDVIPGEILFRLYDTYGFPADLTADIARERNLEVDTEGFEECMQAQRVRARAASNFGIEKDSLQSASSTHFLGYELEHSEASVLEILVDGSWIARLSMVNPVVRLATQACSSIQLRDSKLLIREKRVRPFFTVANSHQARSRLEIRLPQRLIRIDVIRFVRTIRLRIYCTAL